MSLDLDLVGNAMQMAVCRLQPGQTVYCEAGKFLFSTAGLTAVTRLSKPSAAGQAGQGGMLSGLMRTAVDAGKRMLAGESLAFQYFTNNGREAEVLARWREDAARGTRAASGWEQTLEAASDGRVEVLLFQDGVEHAAFRCPACGRASAAGGSCPLDGTSLERTDAGLDLAVHQTLTHGGEVWAIRHQPDLAPVEGIGALLRF